MRVMPVAADFLCFVDGEQVAWNNEFGLNVRWRAAREAASMVNADLKLAAEIVTKQVRVELNNENVLIVADRFYSKEE